MNAPLADEFTPAALQSWLATQGWGEARLSVLAGDVSPRRYVRVSAGPDRAAILALYPQAVRSTAERFVRSTKLLSSVGVRVPRILGADLGVGLMLVEDLGRQTLYERRLSWAQRSPWFARAAEALVALRGIDTRAVHALNPDLDEALLLRELEQTWSLLLHERLRDEPGLAQDLRAALGVVCAQSTGAGLVVCHRDFMARNLVPLADGGLAILDHQDVRLGPAGYDWASLLNDSLFAPGAVETAIRGLAAGLGIDELSYRRAAVQRGFKAAGTFLAFARRGSDKHLPLVAPTLRRALLHLGRLPEGAAIAAPLRKLLLR